MENVGLWRMLDYRSVGFWRMLGYRGVELWRCWIMEVLDYGGVGL